jgi:hypothetical protein
MNLRKIWAKSTGRKNKEKAKSSKKLAVTWNVAFF